MVRASLALRKGEKIFAEGIESIVWGQVKNSPIWSLLNIVWEVLQLRSNNNNDFK